MQTLSFPVIMNVYEMLTHQVKILILVTMPVQQSPFYSCGLSTSTIEYSSLSVCVSACLSVCLSVCVHDNSKNNGSFHLKLEHIVVYENSSDEFDIGHCPIKVTVTA